MVPTESPQPQITVPDQIEALQPQPHNYSNTEHFFHEENADIAGDTEEEKAEASEKSGNKQNATNIQHIIEAAQMAQAMDNVRSQEVSAEEAQQEELPEEPVQKRESVMKRFFQGISHFFKKLFGSNT